MTFSKRPQKIKASKLYPLEAWYYEEKRGLVVVIRHQKRGVILDCKIPWFMILKSIKKASISPAPKGAGILGD